VILIITEVPEDKEIFKLINEFKRLNQAYEIWEYKNFSLQENDYFYKDQLVDSYPITGIIWRVTEGKFLEYEDLHQYLSDNYFIINPTRVMERCADKIVTDNYLKSNLLQPLPSITTPGEYTLENLNKEWARQNVNFNHFIPNKHVIKPAIGAGGRGIVFYNEDTESIILHEGELLQPHMNSLAKDLIRVGTIGNKIIGSYHRVPVIDNGLANIEQGAIPVLATINNATELSVNVIMVRLHPEAAGIDVFETPDGDSYIIEINSAPGMNGLDTLGIPAWEYLAQYIVNKTSI
jgi:glutathione synthase/RimK-type ligase-like ATP-grasp enzyme